MLKDKIYLKVTDPISQNERFYSNDASLPKKLWFQISVIVLVILDALRLPPSTSDIFVTLPCWFILNKVMYRDKDYQI